MGHKWLKKIQNKRDERKNKFMVLASAAHRAINQDKNGNNKAI